MANSMRVNAELDSESEDEDEESSPPSPPRYRNGSVFVA